MLLIKITVSCASQLQVESEFCSVMKHLFHNLLQLS